MSWFDNKEKKAIEDAKTMMLVIAYFVSGVLGLGLFAFLSQ
jgi:hypothetical protein